MEKGDTSVLIDLLNDKIDPNTLTNVILQQKNLSNFLLSLSTEINNLNEKLKNHIITKHDDLMSHVVGIEKLEGVLEMMCSRTNTLANHTEKVMSKIEEPYNDLSKYIHKLENMQVTCDTLRKLSRINTLITRLKEQKRDPSKASDTVNELKYLFKYTDWKGIQILEQHYEFLNQTSTSLIDEAWNLMKLFKETNNQAMLSIALQVFCNMDILTVSVNKVIVDWKKSFTENLHQILDVKSHFQNNANKSLSNKVPGRVSMPTAGQAASFRASFWIMVDKLVNYIDNTLHNVILLTQTLHRKRDSATQKYLIECVMDNYDNLDEFTQEMLSGDIQKSVYEFQIWISGNLKVAFQEMCSTAENANQIKPTLESEYPKLLKLFQDLNNKLTNQLITSSSESTNQSISNYANSPDCYFRSFLVEFEQVYLAKSLVKLFDIVKESFDSGKEDRKLPNDDELINFGRVISTEITVANVDSNLMFQTVKNIGKMIDMICTKFESSLSVEYADEAFQITSPITTCQKRNFKVINLISRFVQIVERDVIGQLRMSSGSTNEQLIRDKLKHCQRVIITCIQPLLDNIKNAMEEIISTIHSENFDIVHENVTFEGSFMMNEMKDFINRIRSQYLNEIHDDNIIGQLLQPIANHILEFYLINICLVRPVNEGGREKLSSDLDRFDTLVLNPLLSKKGGNLSSNLLLIHNSGDLVIGLKRLKTFRVFLFQSTENIVENTKKQLPTNLPVSYILHHLFSRAPIELKSPHSSAGWSLNRYSNWLISHTNENERLAFIKGALEAYANMIRLQDKANYHEIYNQMQTIMNVVMSK